MRIFTHDHGDPPEPVCFLAQFRPDVPCEGRLVRAHLIPRQLLKREGHEALIPDGRTWVWACGGIVGSTGHHGMLDYSRTLRIPADELPESVWAVAGELGLTWWLEREYGGRAGRPAHAASNQPFGGRVVTGVPPEVERLHMESWATEYEGNRVWVVERDIAERAVTDALERQRREIVETLLEALRCDGIVLCRKDIPDA